MGKSKYYAVKNGYYTGILHSWDECKNSINGYANAEYKSFAELSDAEDYMKGIGKVSRLVDIAANSDKLIIYIDGSYSEDSNRYSFGCIFIDKSGEIGSIARYGDDQEALGLRNVAGELQGAMIAVKWAYEKGYKKIQINYDYEGIYKWFSGEWRAKNDIPKRYVEYMNGFRDIIEIEFNKIQGHSGDFFNEKVDRLAKEALTCGKRISKGDDWIKVNNLQEDDLTVILELLKDELKDIDIKEINQVSYIKMYKIEDKVREKVIVKYYLEKNQLMIQGKPQRIFSVLLTFITELVDEEDMPKIFNDYCKLEVKKENIDDLTIWYLPNATKHITPKIIKSLRQAIYNLNIHGEMEEYTFISFPALRGLEGVLKLILSKYKIPYCGKFDMFEKKDNDTYKLMEKYEKNLGSPLKIKCTNKLYNHFHKNRNELFHWNDPSFVFDDTRIIGSMEQAHKLIVDTLQYIEEYYNIN